MLYEGFIMAGVVSCLISFFITSVNGFIAGYSCYIIAIFIVMINIVRNMKEVQHLLTVSMLTLGPFLYTLVLLTFMLYIYIQYKAKIEENHVASSYYSFNNIINALMILQFYLLYDNYRKQDSSSPFLSKSKISILYLIATIILLCCLTLNTILKYYSTDGFSLLTSAIYTID